MANMETLEYTYNNKLWRLCSTKADNNSFFHAAFGTRGEDNIYYDPQAQYRRRRYINFLTYYQKGTMPPSMEIILRRCLNSDDQSKDTSLQDDLASHISDLSEKSIAIEEVPFLVTLENLKIVVLPKLRPEKAIIMNQIPKILGTYPNPVGLPKNEVVLCLEGEVFSRLEPAEAREVPQKSIAPSTYDLGKYKQVGSVREKTALYHVDLLLLIVIDTVQKLDTWRISVMNREAGHFDDIVLERSSGATLLQAKFKENSTKKITLENLLSPSARGDYNLIKYFVSYQKIKKKFEIKNLVIYTNIKFSEEVYKFLNMTHSDDLNDVVCSFYTFTEEMLLPLKTAVEHSENRDTEISKITNEDVKDFLYHLRFYCDRSRNALRNAIEVLWRVSELRNKASLWEIHFKVMNWYQQDKGEYLTNVHVNAMLSEIWRDKYYQTLEGYNVHFQDIGSMFQEPKQMLHIVIEDIYLLHVIKLYRALWKEKSKVLWINPKDDVYTQKLVLEAFRKLHYQFLIVVWPKDTKERVVTEICLELKDILNQGTKYKKVILVAEEMLLSGQCELTTDDYDIIKDFVSFWELTEDTRSRLLLQENIIFQGARIRLNNLFAPQKIEDYKEVLNLELLKKLVEQEDITVGMPVLGLEENIAQYYLPRKFKRKIYKNGDDEDSEDNFSEDTIHNVKEKIAVISGSAGSGKSTVLSQVAMIFKEKHPSLWIININLNECTNILRDIMIQGRETIDVTELLNSRVATKFTNHLERILFSTNEKVVLILDGVDEIVPDYNNFLINLLDQCREAPNLAKIIVATRPHLTQELEEVFKVTAFSLQPLSGQEQVDLLTAYWTYTLKAEENTRRCNQYAKTLVKKISLWTNKDFADTPLQIKMLAEVFCEAGNNWDGCKRYLNGDTDVPILPEKIDIVGLYDMFIRKKRDVFLEKANPSGNPTANLVLTRYFEECLVYHRSFALEVVLGKASQLFTNYNCDYKDMEDYILKTGIVERSCNKFQFIHVTFAEYFVADGILRELQLPNENVEFQKFFIDKILSEETFFATRAFLDGFLRNNAISLPFNVSKSYSEMLTWKRILNLQILLKLEDFLAIRKLVLNLSYGKTLGDSEIHLDEEKQPKGLALNYCSATSKKKIFPFRRILNLAETSKTIPKPTTSGWTSILNKCDTESLHTAAENGDIQTIKNLIERGVDINVKDFKVRTALHLAVTNGHSDIVQLLLQNGADTNITDDTGHIASSNLYHPLDKDEDQLVFAAKSTVKHKGGNWMNKLRNKFFGRSIRDKNMAQLSALEMVYDKCSSDDDKSYCSESYNYINSPALSTKSVYMLNTAKEISVDTTTDADWHISSVKLSRAEVHIDPRDVQLHSTSDVRNKGNIAKFRGLLRTNVESAKVLEDEDTYFDFRDSAYCNASRSPERKYELNTANEFSVDTTTTDSCHRMSSKLLQAIVHLEAIGDSSASSAESIVSVENVQLNLTAENEALHVVAVDGQLDALRTLLDRGVDVNIKDDEGRTPLHSAASQGHSDIVEFLLDRGVNVNLKDNDGNTALHVADEEEHLDIVKLLVRRGADVGIADGNGNTALHCAAECDRLNTVEYLVREANADVSVKGNGGRTPLHSAVKWGNLDVAKFLLECGESNVNSTDAVGRTPLHYAAEWHDLDTVELLVENKADINVGDCEGYTALHLAIKWGNLDTVEYLVGKGADVNARNGKGRTVLHYVAKEGEFDTLKFLLENGADPSIRDKNDCMALNLAQSEGHMDIVTYLCTTNDTKCTEEEKLKL